MLELFETYILGIIAWFMVGAIVLPLLATLWDFARYFLSITNSETTFKETRKFYD